MKITNRRRIFSWISGLMTPFTGAGWAGLLLTGVGAAAGQSQTLPASAGSELASLPGHVHSFARPQFDAGEAPNSLRMGGFDLIIAKTPCTAKSARQTHRRSTEPEIAAVSSLADAADYGARFGRE